MRIISLSPATTEVLFAINAGNQIIANTYLCDYPPEAKKIPKVGSFSNVDFDKIKKFNPNLVITSTVKLHGLTPDGIFTCRVSLWSETLYRRPFIHALKSVAFWYMGKINN